MHVIDRQRRLNEIRYCEHAVLLSLSFREVIFRELFKSVFTNSKTYFYNRISLKKRQKSTSISRDDIDTSTTVHLPNRNNQNYYTLTARVRV